MFGVITLKATQLPYFCNQCKIGHDNDNQQLKLAQCYPFQKILLVLPLFQF